MLRSKSGKSRGLAFVGFCTEEEARRAQRYFHKSFYDTRKLSVEEALPVGDTRLHRPWSKRVSSTAAVAPSAVAPRPAAKGSKDKRLQEFLQLMQPRSKKHFWADDDDKVPDDERDPPQKKSESEPDGENPSTVSSRQDEAEAEAEVKEASPSRSKETVGKAAENGRLFVRNVPFQTTEDDLKKHFGAFGPVTEVTIPVDESNRSKGYAFVLFLVPEHATKALLGVDGTIFQGRLLHVIPALANPNANPNPNTNPGKANDNSSYKKAKAQQQKQQAGDSRNWNALFVRADAAVSAVASDLGVSKGRMFEEDEDNPSANSAAVRVALSETRVIEETKRFLGEQGVDVAALEKGVREPASVQRSQRVLLLKNVPHDANQLELNQLFAAHGSIERFVMPPSKTMALVAFHSSKDAQKAFQRLAYKRYKRVPIYLEFAPENCVKPASTSDEAPQGLPLVEDSVEDNSLKLHTLYIKNLNFDTTEESLRKHFIKLLGKDTVKHATIPTKVGSKDLSLGFGFVECVDQEATRRGLRKANGSTLDGHVLSVTLSKPNKSKAPALTPSKRKRATDAMVNPPDLSATKLVVRNLAFEANKKELKQLFSAYGHINSVRLPKKFDGTHRGFAFIDFVTHEEAKSAFKALAATHLYGRKLVLEWAQDTKIMTTMLSQK